MRGRVRLLATAVLLVGTVGIRAAAAQTVVVRRAPAGSAVEVVVNTTTVGTATADARGDALIPVDLSKHTGKAEAGMNILVDTCETLRRVVLVEPGVRAPAPGVGCDRREVIGLFLVRPVSNVVVFVDGVNPRVLLIQGRYSLADPGPGSMWQPAPAGLTLAAGAGFRTFRDARFAACGNLEDCSGGGAGVAYAAALAFWITPYIGAEASFVRPSEPEFSGRGSTFEFDAGFDARVVTVAGLVGVPFGPVRLYGKVGANHHWAAFRTTQTNNPVTTIVDGVEQTLPAATQTFELRTAGWSWMFGGGTEVWVTRRVGLYGEFGRTSLKGPGLEGADGRLDEALTTVVAGVKFFLWQ